MSVLVMPTEDAGVTELVRALAIDTAPVFEPLLGHARYKGAHGGRGSGKSHFFADSLIEACILRPGLRAACVREYQKSTAQSVKALIEEKIEKFGLGHLFEVRKTEIGTPGGGLIIFLGMQSHTADSIKSLQNFDIIWVEEAQALSAFSLEILYPTLRKDGSEYWFSWNPTDPSDPVDKFLRVDHAEDAIVVEANWQNNPWFPSVLDADRRFDLRRGQDRYAHIWLGKYRSMSQARVFHNWRVEEFDTPDEARFFFGADWGFSIDPTVLVRCWISGKTLYVDWEAYKIGCEIDHIPALFAGPDEQCTPPRWPCPNPREYRGVPGSRRWTIRADSARPETISYVRKRGFKIQPALKGKGSVEDGIEFMQSYDIVVHPRCKHTADELSTYAWKVDKKTQEVLPMLEDKDNHVVDALRYALEGARTGGSMLTVLG